MKVYKHILLAVDLEAPSSWKRALPIVDAMAECFSARITICTVATTAEAVVKGEYWPVAYQDRLAEKHAQLDAIAAEIRGKVSVDVEIGTGSTAGGIVDVADRVGADLIALSSHQHKLIDFLVSPKAARVSDMANCSVLVIRTEQR